MKVEVATLIPIENGGRSNINVKPNYLRRKLKIITTKIYNSKNITLN